VSDLVTGADGLARCGWGASTPDYVAYHDEEWGRPVTDDVHLFERLTLEAFQSGLSWLTILRKREGFRQAFAGFDPEVVARYGEADVDRLMADAGIVRNRLKIQAAITNARALLDLHDAGETLRDLVWAHRSDGPAPRSFADVPASTPASKALAKTLKSRGFVFVGPTTLYAGMQACGVVDDHLDGCHAREATEAERARVT
jgi:DNA-3-methyladenine glycosylase I